MTPLVLVHGFLGGSDQWHLQAPLAVGREVIAVDLPGFGRNAHLPAIDGIGDFADWVLAHLSEHGIERFDLLGHSMGGMIAQEMLRLAPERIVRLVLYGTGALGAMPGRFEPLETSMARAREDGAGPTARRLSAKWFVKGESDLEWPATARIAERSSLPAILGGLAAMRDWSGAENLAMIGLPTLVLWGDRDRAYPWSQVERLWRGIGGSSLAVLPDCGHAAHAEAPKLFNAMLERFLTTAHVPEALDL